MAIVGIVEAKAKLSTLLERVARGEQIVITRRGKPIARLMPISTTRKIKTSGVMAKLRATREGVTLGGLSWKELRDTGRKY